MPQAQRQRFLEQRAQPAQHQLCLEQRALQEQRAQLEQHRQCLEQRALQEHLAQLAQRQLSQAQRALQEQHQLCLEQRALLEQRAQLAQHQLSPAQQARPASPVASERLAQPARYQRRRSRSSIRISACPAEARSPSKSSAGRSVGTRGCLPPP